MPVTASLIVGGVGAVTSGIKAYKAHKALKELQKQQLPNYSISPEMQHAYSRAEGMTNRGFTGAEEAAFKANLGQSSNTSYQQAMDQSGGNMAQAILGGINSGNVNALNQFAAQDAQQRRANIAYADQLAGQLQNQQNMATGQEINYRMAQEQAYGKALQDNLNNAQSAFNYGMTMGVGGIESENPWWKKKAPATQPTSQYIAAPYVPTTVMQGQYGAPPVSTPEPSSVFGQGNIVTGINYKNPFQWP